MTGPHRTVQWRIIVPMRTLVGLVVVMLTGCAASANVAETPDRTIESCSVWAFDHLRTEVTSDAQEPDTDITVFKGTTPVLALNRQQGSVRVDVLAEPVFYETRSTVYIDVKTRTDDGREVSRLAGEVPSALDDGRLRLESDDVTATLVGRCVGTRSSTRRTWEDRPFTDPHTDPRAF